ncbi:hypothetical protein GF1_26370 [Desulfolithobacter dissulfuricans]|uniref:4Fe-4S ferredoxin-type domain-containing protein n=1 Tax=Desulfolithobacter dissulfuricans TaxID=2795293 RepID=A0A915U2Q8_9BACT|nr:ferredoxin [Desulfolithobacter dissulfuricans]BCO10261.1 hypothetical protein GF1_26370 [Desulfolithobacter dissulfuricans]
MAEILIDTYFCSNCMTCVELCPEVFYFNEDTEKIELTSINPEITEDVRQAVAYCPEKCIEIKN